MFILPSITPATLNPIPFATTLYTGNGSAQSIITRKDNAAGSLVWIKNRSLSINHFLFDTVRGPTNILRSNVQTTPIILSASLTAFNSNGFNVGSIGEVNNNANNIVAWSFLESRGFFDIVQYTGDTSNSTTRAVSHNLGITPGFIIVKRLDSATPWRIWHRNLDELLAIYLNTPDAAINIFPSVINTANTNASQIFVGSANNVNSSPYIAYLFGHETTTNGRIFCGSFTSDSSGNATVDLGWRPQWLMYKSVNANEDWRILDKARGWGTGGDALLVPNTSAAETALTNYGSPTSTGFTINNAVASTNYIFIAIRDGS